jgi:UDP-N-acetylglucosamine--N-acetylmuramyl-(pentapeptide) pyrophosphoryl-undecaprenol N-acetylglucosamine transferase
MPAAGSGPLRVLIAGGGTGGHVIPGLAIADELRQHYAAEVRFLGTARGMETRLVPQAGYRLDLIHVGQLKGVSFKTRVRTVFDLPVGVVRARHIVGEFKPHIVVGVGGYASGPGMLAALLKRIPTLAFEPNAVPGLANRLVGKWVRAAAVSFPGEQRYFRNAEVTGIPVRAEFFSLAPKPLGAPPCLLVFGGSQGARAINNVMPRIAADLLAAVPGLTIQHQAGARHAEATSAAYTASGATPDRWQVQPFLEDMPKQFEAADLVLARSGASTVAELGAAGKPSLLVPFPQAADDHQRRNAEVMVAAGGAKMLVEADLTPAALLNKLREMLSDRAGLIRMGDSARRIARPNAARRIAEIVVRLSGVW